MAFGIAKFRIAKFSHCEIKIGIVNSKLALRNGIWHCEISHCEIFALRIWYCEIFALRNWNWHCEISHCEIFALRMWYCENFRIAKLHLVNFRIAKWVCEIFALRNGSANSLRKSLFADFPCLSSCLQLHLIFFTFPSIFH